VYKQTQDEVVMEYFETLPLQMTGRTKRIC
jgi:hypothetical protein